MHAMPLLIGVLCVLAIAYRYYSAFLAAKVVHLDDSRPTPAVRFDDGQNYHPTSKWVLFGHHFAAISGAGPLIGPVLAAQFGYMPGLLWIVIGVCLAGAVQDFLVLAASIRRGGKSLARIAGDELGPIAGFAATAAILFIIVVALAGLGKVVTKALGGETVLFPKNSSLVLESGEIRPLGNGLYQITQGGKIDWGNHLSMTMDEPFVLKTSGDLHAIDPAKSIYALPPDAARVVSGSPWGTFTIACTIPIAFFIGLYMYRLRKGHIAEASIVGAALTLGATFAGGWIAHSSLAHYFNLTSTQIIWAMAIYGFIASVLPVWLLLTPRDYLSSFLKIGTLVALVVGVIIANPVLKAAPYNGIFAAGGPVVGAGTAAVKGKIFPFLFITIMCGAISGFHSLVSSGTTPKMIRRESDARAIGYGAMLIEGLVGVVAMIAAASLPPGDYYAMNMDIAAAPAYHEKLVKIGADVDHLNMYDDYTQENLRGRTSGAVTLAVGMAEIFQQAIGRFADVGQTAFKAMWRYWYHFAIMFEALFILTTIDAGTRIGRFLLQEVLGKIHPKLGEARSFPGSIGSTLIIVIAWAYLINANSFGAMWAMFGIANQMLAVIALAVVTAVLANEDRGKYLLVTVLPMLFVATTTTTAALEMLYGHGVTLQTQWAKAVPDAKVVTGALTSGGLILAMLLCTYTILTATAIRVWPVVRGEAQPAPSTVPAE
jgi:carbon starvation protein